jgi:hypothetical protein
MQSLQPLLSTSFKEENGEQIFQYRYQSYFVKSHSNCNNKYKQDEIIQMLDFLIDYIFVKFGGRVF